MFFGIADIFKQAYHPIFFALIATPNTCRAFYNLLPVGLEVEAELFPEKTPGFLIEERPLLCCKPFFFIAAKFFIS